MRNHGHGQERGPRAWAGLAHAPALLTSLTLLLATSAPARASLSDRVPAPGDASPLPPAARVSGQPARYDIRWGPLAGYDFDAKRAESRLLMSASTSLIGPKLGGIEGAIEAGAGTHGARLHPTLGATVGLPWLAVGTEYAGAREKFDATFSLRMPERRGGLFGRGDMFRLDYHPGRHELLAGITFRSPFEPCRLNRPRRTGATLPAGSPRRYAPRPAMALGDSIDANLDAIRHSVTWMGRLLTPHFEPEHFETQAAAYRDHIRIPGHTYREEAARYHHALDAAFTAACDGDGAAGRAVAALAESVLFRDVVAPFDRLLGREKEPRHAGGFCVRGLAAFEGRLAAILPDEPGPASDHGAARARCAEIDRRLLEAVESASVDAGERWKNPFLLWSNRGSLAWLPLDYGIRPERIATQAGWDSTLAGVTGEPFRDANTVEFLMLEQYHLQLKRMIRGTRSYQVTIVHDFRGQNPGGIADLYGWDLVVDGYLAAFTQAVRDLDAGARSRLPQYFLFLDANYYEERGSRQIITFLENLYDPHVPRLNPRDFGPQVAAAHDSLAEAIRRSPALRGLSKRRLREAFRVNVCVTNRFDPSFLLDVTRRDHRKVAFADVTEDDPGSGSALVTGQGIGELYNGSAWEDRSLLLRGTSLLRLKTAARDIFLQQGFREREVPECLRPRPFAAEYAARCESLRAEGWTSDASILVNETGYGLKEATVLKAAIYNLAPPGSSILSFDSLWISDFWAGMFLCAALRGVNALPVGPTPENAPSAAPATLHFLRGTLRTMLQANLYFADDLARSGGCLRVGIYAHDVQTNDFRRRVEAFQMGLKSETFLRRIFPMAPSAMAFLDSFRTRFPEIRRVGLQLRTRPFLHMKSQFFGTAEAFRILRSPLWGRALADYLGIRLKQTQGVGTPGIDAHLFDPLARDFERSLDGDSTGAKDRVIYTFTMGSHNQDLRAMLLDGEVLVALSGQSCLIAMVDSMFMLFVAEWPADLDAFDRLFPKQHPPIYLKPILHGVKDQS